MDTVTCTDDKLDVLAKEVHDGFARAEVEYVRTDERFKAVDQQLRDLKTGQTQIESKLDSKFDGLQRTLLQVGGGLIATLIAGIVALVGVIVTLLITQ